MWKIPDSSHEGSKGFLTRKSAFMRMHRTANREGTGVLGWLICKRSMLSYERDQRWYFSNLPEDILHERLVQLAHGREEIERYYEDAKG